MAEHRGQEGIRNESALGRPLMKSEYSDPPPDLCDLAARYAHRLAKNRRFLNGNKRTAFVVYRLSLKWNGLEITASWEDRYFQMLALTGGEHTEDALAAWLRPATKEA